MLKHTACAADSRVQGLSYIFGEEVKTLDIKYKSLDTMRRIEEKAEEAKLIKFIQDAVGPPLRPALLQTRPAVYKKGKELPDTPDLPKWPFPNKDTFWHKNHAYGITDYDPVTRM